MGRIGEPYVTSRPGHPHDTGDEPAGLGLGFFIAKTLLERAGATVSFQNQAQPDRGAVVRLRWSRPDFERRSSFAAA
jgi:two-component system sensor histidine kinase RegB